MTSWARASSHAAEVLLLRYRAKWLQRTRPIDHGVRALLKPRPMCPPTRWDEHVHTVEVATDLWLRRRRVTRARCYTRAMVRFAMLRDRGVPAVFHMGVRPAPGGAVDAHAWVTVDGTPVCEREPPTYSESFRYPPLCPTHRTS